MGLMDVGGDLKYNQPATESATPGVGEVKTATVSVTHTPDTWNELGGGGGGGGDGPPTRQITSNALTWFLTPPRAWRGSKVS